MNLQAVLDRCAVGISAVCAVHCLALPPLLVMFPLLTGTVFTDEQFHALLLWVILPTSVIAISLARRRHRDNGVLVLVGAGVVLLVVAALWAHEHAAPWIDTALSVAGGALVALGHLRNYRAVRRLQ